MVKLNHFLIFVMCYFDDTWIISDGSGGGSDPVGRVESESAVIFTGKPREFRKNKGKRKLYKFRNLIIKLLIFLIGLES